MLPKLIPETHNPTDEEASTSSSQQAGFQLGRLSGDPNVLGTDQPNPLADVHTLDEFLKQTFKQGTEGDMPARDWLKSQFKTKSAAIRFLDSKGYKPKEIAAHLEIRQQHVRNVLGQELKRGPNEAFQLDTPWGCSHEKSGRPFVDVVLRKDRNDSNASRILLRVCIDCAAGILPGVNEETLQKYLPGVKNNANR